MIQFEENIRENSLKEIAFKMLTAARTAPKARGVDNLIIAMASGETIIQISDKMKEISVRDNMAFFMRDAENILQASTIALIATKIKANGLNCGLCGYPNCAEKNNIPKAPCVFNTNDLGIAIGSAVGIAADNRVDNRVMYSIGLAVKELNLLGEEAAIIFGIPLSASGKSPFFDRKPL
jgi:uncharacterized ferredoxin-like protein